MINKSATKAGEITWNNGNVTVLWVGLNGNTGATVVWVVERINGKLGRSKRLTGGNIHKLAAEIASALPREGRYTYSNAAALAAIA